MIDGSELWVAYVQGFYAMDAILNLFRSYAPDCT